MTLVLSGFDQNSLMTIKEIISAVETALAYQHDGDVVSPMRMSLSRNDRTLLAMPAITPVGAGVKIVSVVPQNAKANLPVTLGVMVFLDPHTAQPLCIMDAGTLTRLRTGAIGAIGIKHLTPLDTDTIGIIGCGVQGTNQAIFACGVRPITKIFAFEPCVDVYDRFVRELAEKLPLVEITKCGDAKGVLSKSDVVVTATTSRNPVIPNDRKILAGKKFISIGSFRPDMQELPDAVYEMTAAVLVDSEHAANEVGDIINPLGKGLIDPSDIIPLSRLVSRGGEDGFPNISVYKAVGDAFFDVVVAEAFYRHAQAAGVGLQIDL